MGRGRYRAELRCWTSDHSQCAGEDARSHEEEVVGAAKRRTPARRARTTVLYVLAGVHVEVCQTIHSIRSQVHRRLLRHDSVTYQTDFRFGTCGFTARATYSFQRGCDSYG